MKWSQGQNKASRTRSEPVKNVHIDSFYLQRAAGLKVLASLDELILFFIDHFLRK